MFAELMKQCPHQWLITYDDSVTIRENFASLNMFEWEMQYGMNNYKQITAGKGKELFITNYGLEQLQTNPKEVIGTNQQLSLNFLD